MAPVTDAFDIAQLRLSPGEGRRIELAVRPGRFALAGEGYDVAPEVVPAVLELSRTLGGGYALRLQLTARLAGPCMRCLQDAAPEFEVDAREVDQPGGGDELSSPYLRDGVLDLRGWARDAVALAAPDQLLCREDCRGLCPECGIDLNEVDGEHGHEAAPDPRWAKLGELKFK